MLRHRVVVAFSGYGQSVFVRYGAFDYRNQSPEQFLTQKRSLSMTQNVSDFASSQCGRRVFFFDVHNLSSTPGFDQLVSMLKQSGVTPVVVTRFGNPPTMGDLMTQDFMVPLPLPTYNIAGDAELAQLIAAATQTSEVTGCVSDFSGDHSFAKATQKAGGLVFAHNAFSTPIDAITIADFDQARRDHRLQQRIGGC
jgi:hypothetical protein